MKYIKVAVPDDFDNEFVTLSDRPDTGEVCPVWQPQYTKLLNHGFVGLVDFYGDDAAVVNAARVSYGNGTKSVREDRALIRYLLSHLHTTPFEMVDFKFHIKAPIFVFRQWHRHRTFSINEYSARYSEMKDEMYEPLIENLAPQSSTNKQGRDMTVLSDSDYTAIMSVVDEVFEQSYHAYKYLLGPNENGDVLPPTEGVNRRLKWCQDAAVAAVVESKKRALESNLPDPYPKEEDLENAIQSYLDQNGVSKISDDFPGIARELARMVLPVATYSEMYWKGNLWNLMHFMRLRCDSHAQYEIRVYADAIKELIQPLIPWSMEAWTDYLHNAERLSRMEVEVIRDMIQELNPESVIDALTNKGVGKRETTEFMAKFGK
jgi:thymidylate synthase (FAD)